MNWITKPNIWYDNVKEPWRFFLFIGIYLLLIVLFGFVAGMFLFCILGLYRIAYFIIISYQNKEK